MSPAFAAGPPNPAPVPCIAMAGVAGELASTPASFRGLQVSLKLETSTTAKASRHKHEPGKQCPCKPLMEPLAGSDLLGQTILRSKRDP